MSTWEELKAIVMTWDWYDANGAWLGRVVDREQIQLLDGQTLIDHPCPKYTLESDDFFAALVAKIDDLEARVAELEK
jgi:hypothetical protein